MAPLCYTAKFDPFLSLDCSPPPPSNKTQSKEGIKFCHLATLIQDKIGCGIKIHGHGGANHDNNLLNLHRCNLGSQVKDLYRILSPFKFADAKIIHEKTGCLGSCESSEYKKLESTKVQEFYFRSCKKGILPCSLKLTLEIPQGEITYEGKKQFVVYDFNSFIADVGGFMGLLLGFSFLSIYDELENLLKSRNLIPLPK